MIDTGSAVFTIVMCAGIVYLTRVGGYLLGLQVRHIGALRPLLESLPGCAMMALIVPAARQGTVPEVVALITVVAVMWKTNNVAVATLLGLSILIVGPWFF